MDGDSGVAAHAAGKNDQTHTEIVSIKEKIDPGKKLVKLSPEGLELKPRIVLTFRTEKPGLKSSNMKIVSSEERLEEAPARNSSKVSDTNESDEESNESSLTSKKIKSQPVSESDEATSDSCNTTTKRSVRCRTKEYSDNVLANAIARKEKSYNDATPSSTQRLSRRIKPTAKVLANKELRIGLETQNNVRMGILTPTDKSPEEGVQTRRSARRKSHEHQSDDNAKIMNPIETSPKKRKLPTRHAIAEDTQNVEDKTPQDPEARRMIKMKKKHLSKLGLKAIEGEAHDAPNDDSTMDSTNSEALAELALKKKMEAEKKIETNKPDEPMEEDDDGLEEIFTEVTDEESDPDDEDFSFKSRRRGGSAPRRATRSSQPEVKAAPEEPVADNQKETPRRSTRLRRGTRAGSTSPCTSEHSDEEVAENHLMLTIRADGSKLLQRALRPSRRPQTPYYPMSENESSDPPEGEEGEAAASPACPAAPKFTIGTCLCEAQSNLYAAPETNNNSNEPLFCRAIETVDNVRVGCSHPAARLADASPAPLLRAGLRAPYLLLCKLHTAQLRRHMCCSTCGLFCTQGSFLQCNKGHLFHLDCGLAPGPKQPAGCPHCGLMNSHSLYLTMKSTWWLPVNRSARRVRVRMRCGNKRVFLPDQRVQYTQAYLGFTTLERSQLESGPVIPADLLPTAPVDVKQLCASPADVEELLAATPGQRLRDAILAGVAPDHLISKISGVNVNKTIEGVGGGSYLHLAAKSGNLGALYLLQYAGANIDATDATLRTPLMVAVLTLLDRSKKKSEKTKTIKGNDSAEDSTNKRADSKVVENKLPVADEEKLLKVIRYLVAAGCDVNFPGPDGMTALHMAAQLGGAAVCSALLAAAGAAVDPRDHGGWTPLVWAAENKHPHVVKLLLSHGADAAATDGEGNGVLHWCALCGDAGSLQALLDRAPPHAVDALNAHSDTPLHVAARQGHYPCVVVLLARGARTDSENAEGELAVEVCSGDCQAAISINMQMALAMKDSVNKYKLLSSDISNGREYHPIPCVNEVDDAPLPDDFVYVTEHVAPAALHVDRTIATMQGCTCAGAGCGAAGGACACAALSVRRWTARGRLLPDFPYHEPPMLFECNQTCGCNLKLCTNTLVTRALARGSVAVRVQVFRCAGARGWGLRAAADIPKGTFVAAYTGELLAVSEADTRARDQYMFALELKPDLLEQCADKTQLCVDAGSYGGAARFINHGCRPSLAPVRVFAAARDLRLPVVALFAARDVPAGEELTFDYGDKFWSVKRKWMKCECGAAECRYPDKEDE